jgi:hypothetical protein
MQPSSRVKAKADGYLPPIIDWTPPGAKITENW